MSLMTLLGLWGAWSFYTIPVSAEPEITIPFISISTALQGAAPADIVRLITRPLEKELATLDGVKKIFSYSRIGLSSVIVEFDVSFDPDDALYRIRQAIDDARRDLPTDIEEPVVSEYNTRDFPLITLAVYGNNAPQKLLTEVAERLEEELEKIPEVEDAQLKGVREEVVEILVDKERLESYGLNLINVARLITGNNLLIQAGIQDTGHGRFAVEVPGTIKTAAEMLSLPLKTVGDTVVKLTDVAQVLSSFKDRDSFARLNGLEAISIDIVRHSDANDIETSAKVRALVQALDGELPPGVAVTVANDDSTWAKNMVNELTGNILTAIALVMILVVSILGVQAGTLVGLGIPFAFMCGFIVLNALGLAFNFMVMFGLLLSMGMLIDGSIVVVELAARCRQAGMNLKEAYGYAANRMLGPITASAATTLAAFIPLMVWPGVTGKFMQYLPITVFAVLAASLFYSLIFTPVLGIVIGNLFAKESTATPPNQPQSQQSLEYSDRSVEDILANSRIHRLYARIMKWSCRNPLFVVSTIFITLLIIIRAWSDFGPGTSFFVTVEPVHANINVLAKGNYSLDTLEKMSVEVDQRIQNLSELETRYLNSEGTSFGPNRGSSDQISGIFLEIVPQEERDISAYEVLDNIRERVSSIPGLIVQVERFSDGPPIGSALEIEVLSNDRAAAESATEKIKMFMSQQQGLVNVQSTIPTRELDWRVDVDRTKAAALGASLTEIGATIQLVTQGLTVDKYLPEDSTDAVDIIVRLPAEQRTLAQLDRLQIQTNQGLVPLSSFVEIHPHAGIDLIARASEKYVYTLTADITSQDVLVSEKVAEIQNWQNSLDGELGAIELQFAGAQESENETVLFLTEAAGIALFLMLILLVTQFNSFYQAFLTISAVAMSLAGVLLMMLLTNTVMSVVMGGMGLVTLAGVVVNNNIVLLDTYNHLRRENPDAPIQQLVIQTGLERLRPVLLTTATTVFGMLPLAFVISINILDQTIQQGSRVAYYWTQLASSLAAGLTFATILTLVFIPAALVLPGTLKAHWNSFKQKFFFSLKAS